METTSRKRRRRRSVLEWALSLDLAPFVFLGTCSAIAFAFLCFFLTLFLKEHVIHLLYQ